MPSTRLRVLPRALAAVVGLLLLGGCGSSAATPSAGPGAGSSSGPTVITVTYADGTITPPPDKVPVPVGAHVVIKVTSDVADEVHNHVTDQEMEVAAGGTVTFDFVADKPGVYEVELHHADKVLLQLQVG